MEIFDTAARIYRARGLQILRHIAVPVLATFAALVFYLAIVAPGVFVTDDPTNVGRQVTEVFQVIAIGLFVALPCLLIGISYSSGAATQIAADYMLGKASDDDEVAASARRCLKPVFWSMIRAALWFAIIGALSVLSMLVGAALESAQIDNPLLAGLGAVFGVVGICVSVLSLPVAFSFYSLVPSAVVVERLPAKAAFKRGLGLRKRLPDEKGTDPIGQLWALVFLVFIVSLAGFGTLAAVLVESNYYLFRGGVIGDWILRATRLLPWYLAMLISVPIWSVTTTLVYFDRRIRKEAYDIELLSADVIRKERQARAAP